MMIQSLKISGFRTLSLALLAAVACHENEPLSPEAGTSVASDQEPQLASAAVPPGVVFLSFDLDNALLGSVHTGTTRSPSPSNILSQLSQAKTKGARAIVRLSGSKSGFTNADATLNVTKWKSMIARFKTVNLAPYIQDGTLMGHYLIDEPDLPSQWGGAPVSQATVESLAKYSKSIWPALPTLVMARARWLASSSITYTYLDAAWGQYSAQKGSLSTYISREVSSAKTKHLGLMFGLNILDGGDGSSGIAGYRSGHWAMSANELKTYGGALLGSTYACGFGMWKYSSSYYARADIKSAMSSLSTKAKAHAKTPCIQ
jgi:hypothetical protein